MVGRDPGHARRADDGPTAPEAVWTTDLERVRAAGTPAVSGGRLYVPVDAVSDTARHRYRVHALAASTGDERWRVPLRAEPNGPPAVSGGRVVVTARSALERGRVVCFRERYGDEEWLVDVDARLTAAPTVAGGFVYVPDWSGRIHALALSDGSALWSRRVDAGDGGRTFTEPAAVRDETLYLGSRSGETGVVALDAMTGETRWKESTRAVTGGPVAHPKGVVVQSHRLVTAFDADGTRLWSFNALEGPVRPVAVDDRGVYVSARNALHAVDWSGEASWTYESAGARLGTPTVAGDAVLLRSGGRVVALARATGEKRWTATPDGTGRGVVTPEAMFLPGADGTVVALGET